MKCIVNYRIVGLDCKEIGFEDYIKRNSRLSIYIDTLHNDNNHRQ
jgi:hypothetical protein